jgi:excisionase family DNA binding protein
MGLGEKIILSGDAAGVERWPGTQLLTTKEAASVLRVSRATVYRLIGSGELGSLRIGASRRIPMAAITELTRRAGVA